MTSLRGRLFATTLAAVALTLALTLALGAVLLGRQVDRSQASVLARRADDLAAQRRHDVTYVREDRTTAQLRILIQPRAKLAQYVPDTSRSSDGTTTVGGRKELYSYRTLPHLGLLVLRPASAGSAAWDPFQRDLILSAIAGVVFAAALSFLVARTITGPVRRVAAATRALAADERHEPLPTGGSDELASLAQAFNEMAEQLQASRDAERAFLLSVSHELKTPLTAIRGYAEGLADGAFDPDEAAATIALEAGRLERLVRDLLDLARMNRHEFAVRHEAVDLAEVARTAIARHEAQARDFGVTLTAEAAESWVEADHDRVVQVASNLVENALRATSAGGTVTVRVEPGRLLVADTGPGIAADDVPRAFERFYLYDKASRDRQVGSGLGLAIVQQLANAMGGRAWVETAPGRGATFGVELPACAAPARLVPLA
ncbi:MAG TPA: HAMP domain-containing sensor histidine kinase [Gaiellaceae bacterium]|nr:HAMP domain-containing sensor histidine kinase [Gaiellaceae bacterium]